jgi:hypothetical protein
MPRRVLIEYVGDTQSFSESRHEAVPIEGGTRRYVDPDSAKSLVKKGVARIVDENAKVDDNDDETDETGGEDDQTDQPGGFVGGGN